MQKSAYVIKDTHLILDLPRGEYPLLIRDLPSEEKPREKLMAHGPEFLTPKELLALILQVGTTKEDLFAMAERLVESYKGTNILNERDPKRLSKDAEISAVKACAIVAMGELARRQYSMKVDPRRTIRNAKDVHDHLYHMRDLPQEELRTLFLNAHNKVILDERISMGSVNSNFTIAREVFRPGVEVNAVGVVIVHNHPSGDPTPSAADIEMTEKLIEAGKILGIRVLDHVIIGRDSFTSVKADYN